MAVAPSRIGPGRKTRGGTPSKKAASVLRATQVLRSTPHPAKKMATALSPRTVRSRKAAPPPSTKANDASPAKTPDASYQLDPARVLELQSDYVHSISLLWRDMLEGKNPALSGDKRFRGDAWTGLHAYLAEIYILNSRLMVQLAESVQADAKTQSKIRFAVQQWVDAMSPANYFATNPEAQQRVIETGGESLGAGLTNILSDLQKGRISQTDESAFEIGRNVAVTEGSVVFQNDIFQLIQYRPQTKTVYERPLLIVPPCINKFYILDLQPENSFVRHTVAQGHTVFLISWRNPTPAQAGFTWDDYVEEGTIRAIRVVQDISRQARLNLLGFCVGGTLLGTALAVLEARGQKVAQSLTLLTTLLDFSDAGVLSVLVDEAQVQMRERTIGGVAADGTCNGQVGLMPGRDLAASFSFLRPNDLVWNYVVSNYLKGNAPVPFDLLYWNADSTNLPGPFFAWYLRNTYLENRLKVPSLVQVCGVPVDLSRIDVPTYIYASRDDHIVPWPSAYASTQLLGGPVRFVLGASGHIAGVVNPPLKGKRSHWVSESLQGRFPADARSWLDTAHEVSGSWWPDWFHWLAGFGGSPMRPPRAAGNKHYRAIEAAPGAYVRARAA